MMLKPSSITEVAVALHPSTPLRGMSLRMPPVYRVDDGRAILDIVRLRDYARRRVTLR
jgi:hypothetical protein